MGVVLIFYNKGAVLKRVSMKARRRLASAVVLSLAILCGSVPGFCAKGETYKVRKGDTLYKIAKTHKTTTQALKKVNGLKSDALEVGQVLKIRATKTSKAPVETVAPVAEVIGEPVQESSWEQFIDQTYTVKRGDTLYRIAKTFQVDLATLKNANALAGNDLKVGQVLVIPTAVARVAALPSEPLRVEPAPLAAAATPAPQAAPQQATPVVVAPVTPPAAVESTPLRDRLVEAGFNMLGARYRFGGTSEKTGLDCSALVRNIFAKVNLTLPRTSREQFKEGEHVAREDLQKGDLVFFSSRGKTPTHVGIYIGDGQFIHASSKARKVTVADLNKTWYKLRYIGARRIMGLWWEDLDAHEDYPPSSPER